MPHDPISAIGKNTSDDWQLRPQAHAAALSPSASALKRVLSQDKIKEIMNNFNMADALAIASQKQYRFWGRAGIYAIAIAAIIGTALILRVDEKFGVEVKWAALTVEYGVLLLAFLIAQWLGIKRPFERWMQKRGTAEILRVQLFDEVTQAQEPLRENELPLLPLQLEYFRRYQLDVQRAYYNGRGKQHAQAAGSSKKWMLGSSLLTVLWALIAGAAAIHLLAQQGIMNLPNWLQAMQLEKFERWIMALGVVASSLYAASASRSLMDLDARNAARYQTTSENLEHITETLLEETRQAAKNGDRDKVLGFIRLVQNQISSEHREWVMLREVAPDATALLAQSGAPVIVGKTET